MRATGNLYEARKQFRKLRLQADAELLAPHVRGAPLTKQQVLADLCEHDLIETYRYADEGPPAHLERGKCGEVPGWVVTTPDPRLGDGITVVYATDDSVHTTGAVGDAMSLAERDVHAVPYQDMPPEEAAARRRRDGHAQQVAEQAVHADLYVTERPYLYNPTWDVARSVTVCSVDDALPMVGLYLRSQGEYLVAHNYRFNRGLFYWVGTRELLPSGWRWFSACVQHSTSVGDHALTTLGGSLLQRVDRALEARDAIHLALNQPQNNDTQDEALSQLDVILLFLMGAVDAAARVAHIVFDFPAADMFKAAWQNRRPTGWLAKVREQDPDLAAVVEPGAQGAHTLTILRLLRNSVHGTALQGLAVEARFDPVASLVGLPEADAAELLLSMDSLGGREAWGVHAELAGRFHVDPGVFADRLFEAVLRLLNDLMTTTPVERLSGVELDASHVGPPADQKGGGPFDERNRTSIRWQLGF